MSNRLGEVDSERPGGGELGRLLLVLALLLVDPVAYCERACSMSVRAVCASGVGSCHFATNVSRMSSGSKDVSVGWMGDSDSDSDSWKCERASAACRGGR